MSDPSLTIAQISRSAGVVRVTIPADAAHNLDKLQKVVANVAARLGCGACHSGRDVLFQMENDLHVNPQTLQVGPVIG
jgi:hypothetical protein